MIPTKRILVAINGNPTDRETVALACQVAKRDKAQVIAIYVIEVKRTLPLDVELPPESAKGEEVLEQAEQVAEAWDLDFQAELLQARDVGTAIVDEASERGADLVIVGLPFKKRFGEFDLGKTAPYVLKNAPCRVWVLREQSP